jgi:cell division septation protein DedD
MSADPFEVDTARDNRRRLWGGAVLLAIAVIVLPLLLDGAGSESKFRRVEKLREEPPRIIDELGNSSTMTIPETMLPIIPEADTVSVDLNNSSNTQQAAGENSNQQRVSTVDPSQRGDTAGSADQATPQLENALPEIEDISLVDQNLTDSTVNVSGGTESARGSGTDSTGDSTTESAGGRGADSTGGDSAGGEDSLTEQQPGPDLTAWVVQAGAYTLEVDALAVRDQLRQAGYASFVRDRQASDEPFRVLVGPMIKEQRALDAREQVALLLGSDAIVLSYP